MRNTQSSLLLEHEAQVEGEGTRRRRHHTGEGARYSTASTPTKIRFISHLTAPPFITPCPSPQAFQAHKFHSSPLTSSTCSSGVCSGDSTSSCLPALTEAPSALSSKHTQPTSHLRSSEAFPPAPAFIGCFLPTFLQSPVVTPPPAC